MSRRGGRHTSPQNCRETRELFLPPRVHAVRNRMLLMWTAVFSVILSLLVSSLLSGCLVGPDYRKPVVEAPAAFVEPGPWKVSAPRDHLPKGTWWTIYRDPILERLVTQATAANQTIASAIARRDQARALARLDRADLFPQIAVNASAERGRTPSTGRSLSSE